MLAKRKRRSYEEQERQPLRGRPTEDFMSSKFEAINKGKGLHHSARMAGCGEIECPFSCLSNDCAMYIHVHHLHIHVHVLWLYLTG